MSMSKKQYFKRKNNVESQGRFAGLKKCWTDEDNRAETITLVIALVIIIGAGALEDYLDNKKAKKDIKIQREYTEKQSQIINWCDSSAHMSK